VHAVRIETLARLGAEPRSEGATFIQHPGTGELQSSASADIICKFVVGKKRALRTDTTTDTNQKGLSVSR